MSAHDAFAETLQVMRGPIQRVTRGDWQRALEQNIQTFNGDAIEASELLCALIANLENRYDRDTLGDVRHEFEQLKDALEELDRTSCALGNMSDADLAEWQADQEIEEGVWK